MVGIFRGLSREERVPGKIFASRRVGADPCFAPHRTQIRIHMTSIGRWLIIAAAAAVLPTCGPRPVRDSPPRTPVSAQAQPPEPSSPDAGLPAVPLTGKGVIVPSDVQLEPAPKTAQPATPAANAAVGPNAN